MTAPTLTTARLRLRAPAASDLDASAAMWGDPEVVRFIGGKTFTRSEVWARLLRYAGMWTLLGHGFWMIEDRESGKFVGEIGIMDAKRDIDPAIVEPEVGWALSPAAHGRGIATEALDAVLGWADHELAAPTLVCMIEDGNGASVAVARKFAFVRYATAIYGGDEVALYRRARFAKP